MIVGIYKKFISKKWILRAKSPRIDNLLKATKSATRNMLIDEKNFKDLMICFTRCIGKKSIQMLNLHYHKWERLGTWSKKYLIVDVYIQDKVLDKLKETKDTELDNTKILIDRC